MMKNTEDFYNKTAASWAEDGIINIAGLVHVKNTQRQVCSFLKKKLLMTERFGEILYLSVFSCAA